MVSGNESKAANARRVREWRRRQKENPEKHEEYKRKEHERYRRRKEKGLLPSITEMNSRDQRAERKRWRTNQREKRKRDNLQKHSLERLMTPPISPDPTHELQRTATMKRRGRKKVRRDRSKAYRELYKLRICLKKEKKLREKYKKRYQRLKRKSANKEEKEVEMLIKKNETKKALLLHTIITNKIKKRYMASKSQEEKQLISSLICSFKILRRLRLTSYLRSKTGISRHYCISKQRKRKSSVKPAALKEKVEAFLERDDNTRIKAGKKSTKTRKGEKRQIRLLNDDLKNLHDKFLTEYTCKISYSLFCFLRPFHVRPPTATDRETCQCKIHENLQFKLEKCKQHGALATKEIDPIIKSMTCDPKNKICMYRECSTCKDRLIDFDLTEGDKQVSWFVWKAQRREKERIVNGEATTTTVSMTVKEPDFGSLRILSEGHSKGHKAYI